MAFMDADVTTGCDVCTCCMWHERVLMVCIWSRASNAVTSFLQRRESWRHLVPAIYPVTPKGARRHATACTGWELLRGLVALSLGCAGILPSGR